MKFKNLDFSETKKCHECLLRSFSERERERERDIRLTVPQVIS